MRIRRSLLDHFFSKSVLQWTYWKVAYILYEVIIIREEKNQRKVAKVYNK